MKIKPHLLTDGYKLGHIRQYPEGTQYVYSNLTARSSSHFGAEGFDNKVVFFGLQGFLKEVLIEGWNEGFFNRPKDEVVAEYKRRMDGYLGKDSVNVDHIAALHDLGYLPLAIRALPEGSRVNVQVPFLTVVNTDPRFFWLTNYIETVLSNEVWKATTVATIAYQYRKVLDEYVALTGSSPEFADWQLHDFSMRGMSGWNDSAKSGAAHLIGSLGYGTDTLPAIDYLEAYYSADTSRELVAGSVPATEHSVMCMGGKDDEIGTFRRLIKDIYPSGIVSIVSDTWDFWKVITEYSVALKDEILSRTPDALDNAKVVFRPDSGDPVKIVAGLTVYEVAEGVLTSDVYVNADVLKEGNKYYVNECEAVWNTFDNGVKYFALKRGDEVPEHIVKGAVECLYDIFGGDMTAKGYKTLNQRVGLIYGDSITLKRQKEILERLAAKGFSAGNIVFGVGSYTYQYLTRDTFGMAVKATYGVVDGKPRELFKDPATGDGVKKSARGLLRVTKEGNDYVLHDQQTITQFVVEDSLLEYAFLDGVLLNEQTYAQIKERLKQEK